MTATKSLLAREGALNRRHPKMRSRAALVVLLLRRVSIIRDTLDMDADDVTFVGAVFNAWCKSVTHLYTTDGKIDVDAYNASWTHPRELPGKAGFRLQRSLALTAAMRDRIKKPAHDTPQMRAMFGLPPKPA